MGSWIGSLVVEDTKVFSPKNPDGTVKRNRKGDPVVVFSTKRTIELTRNVETIVFAVGRGKGGEPVITDTREQATGAAGLTNRGPLPGEAYCKPGAKRALTVSAWARDAERLIGPAGVARIMTELACEGFVGFKIPRPA